MRNVLVGVPKGTNALSEGMYSSIIKTALPDTGEVLTTSEMDIFLMALQEETYDTVICMEDIGMDNPYADTMLEYGFQKKVCVFIIPDRCLGDSYLERYVLAGCHRILLQKDLNIDSLKRAVEKGFASEEDALVYLGLRLPPVKVEPEKKEDSGPGGTQISRRYLGNGIAATILCGLDAKKLAMQGKEGDPVLSKVVANTGQISLPTEVMPYKEFHFDEIWVEKYKESIREYYRTQGLRILKNYENGAITRTAFENDVIKELQNRNLTREQAEIVCTSFMKDVLSYGKIDALLQTPDVTDVRLMNKDTVNVQYKGVWYRTNITFESKEVYEAFIGRMCNSNKSAVNRNEPEGIFTDIDTFPNLTLRITVTHGMLSTNKNYGSHIRIATKQKKTVETLLADQFFDERQASLLIEAVRNKESIIICGGSGSGKTILLNMLIEYFDPSICGTCIQESDELHSETHPNIEFLHSITPKGEGSSGYSLKKLATTSLLKNASLFIIGEIKGDEAADFMAASRTTKVYATTHAEDFTGALPRLTELAKVKADYSQEEILRILSKNIGYVVYCEKYKCKQIAKVLGFDEIRKDVIYELYDFDAKEESNG